MQFDDVVKCFDKLCLKDVMNDEESNVVVGKLDRVIYLMNRQTRIQVKVNFSRTDIIEVVETETEKYVWSCYQCQLNGVSHRYSQI